MSRWRVISASLIAGAFMLAMPPALQSAPDDTKPAANDAATATAYSDLMKKYDPAQEPKLDSHSPTQAEVQAHRAKWTAWRKERQMAFEEFVAAHDTAPESNRLRIELGRESMQTNAKRARDLFNAVVESSKNPAEVTEAKVWVAYTYYDAAPDSAKKLLAEVLKNGSAPDWQAKAGMTLAQLYEDGENWAEARSTYETVAKQFGSSEVAKQVPPSLRRLEIQEKGLLEEGKPWPGLSVKGLNGEPMDTSKLLGKVVLVDFWATWCGPCRAELPHVKETYKEFHDKGFEILAISLDSERDTLQSFIATEQMPWPQYFDGKGWENEIAAQFGIRSIPDTFLLDRKGIIRHRGLSGEELKKSVAELLSAAQ